MRMHGVCIPNKCEAAAFLDYAELMSAYPDKRPRPYHYHVFERGHVLLKIVQPCRVSS